MKEKLSKEVNQTVTNFTLAYPELKGSVEAFKKYEKRYGKIDERREAEYLLRLRHIQLIEESFRRVVKPDDQKQVWAYFFKKKKPEAWEKKMLDEAVEKWMYTIAQELGLTREF